MRRFFKKIKRKCLHMRLQPIQVFCSHHVCEYYEEDTMFYGDWMHIDEFKSRVVALQQSGVDFISLTEAYNHICHDIIRSKKYAVLTFDDGYASLKEILPWLEEQKIPAVLFINGKYLDTKSYRKSPKEKYLSKEELFMLTSPLIEIGNHGWEHERATEMTELEFAESLKRNVSMMKLHPNYIPFWAYTYGSHSNKTDSYLLQQNLVPIYIDGMKNYNEPNHIHRELL